MEKNGKYYSASFEISKETFEWFLGSNSNSDPDYMREYCEGIKTHAVDLGDRVKILSFELPLRVVAEAGEFIWLIEMALRGGENENKVRCDDLKTMIDALR